MSRTVTAALALGALLAGAARLRPMVGAVRRGRALAARTAAFEREAGGPALLAIGDSLAVGVGAERPEDSVPGRVAAAVPQLTVHNLALCGARLEDLQAQLHAAPRSRYDALLIAAGANDVIRGASLHAAGTALRRLLAQARRRARMVVVLTSANVGGAPVLPWVLCRVFTLRSRRMRDLAAHACALHGAHFVDLFAEPSRDLFARDPQRYYGADGLHPSSESYRVCWERIRRETPLAAHLRASGRARVLLSTAASTTRTSP